MTEHKHRPIPAAARGTVRRRRVDGGRQQVIKIRFTETEYQAITEGAAAEHMSVQRFLAEGALTRRPQASAALVAEIAGLRRLVANHANNMNQLARRLNAGGRPDNSIAPALAAVCRTLSRLDNALDSLGIPASGGNISPPPRASSAPGNAPPGAAESRDHDR